MMDKKYNELIEFLKRRGSAAVAFSGGVDSSLLLFAANEALKEKSIAVTVSSVFIPERELKEAEEFCSDHGIRQVILNMDVLAEDGVRQNPKDRCYICKKAIFKRVLDIALENGIKYVVEGSNLDDTGDYRPGLKALKELEIISPFVECGFKKADIRRIAKELKLPVWDKPSCACLASRFEYGAELKAEDLKMVERAEELLKNLGFKQNRVRVHGRLARIETEKDDMQKLNDPVFREEITAGFRKYGFSYVTMDLEGFRSGSMNEVLKTGEKNGS